MGEPLPCSRALEQAYDKSVKPRSYVSGDKVWLNSKYIKIKQNRKLEAKFFRPFRVLHPINKQAYKLKRLNRWRIHDVFHVSLLEQDTTRKGQVDKNLMEMEFKASNSEEYKMEAIWDSAVCANKAEGHLQGLYYLIA